MTKPNPEVMGTCDLHDGDHARTNDCLYWKPPINWKPVPTATGDDEIRLPKLKSRILTATGEARKDACPNCGRSDGWHKAEGHPPPPIGDSRKIVWLTDGDMDWWGVRAYGNRGGTDYDSDYGWMNNGAKESATVLFWMEGPHNPHYPAPTPSPAQQEPALPPLDDYRYKTSEEALLLPLPVQLLRLEHINKELCRSHNTLLIDGAKIERELKQALCSRDEWRQLVRDGENVRMEQAKSLHILEESEVHRKELIAQLQAITEKLAEPMPPIWEPASLTAGKMMPSDEDEHFRYKQYVKLEDYTKLRDLLKGEVG